MLGAVHSNAVQKREICADGVDSSIHGANDSIRARVGAMTEFNNGFITALALFAEHKNQRSIGYDHRLYGASDHLFDIEIPKRLPNKLKTRVKKLKHMALKNRLNYMENPKTTELSDRLFKEAEDILIAVDKQYFVKKVKVHYR